MIGVVYEGTDVTGELRTTFDEGTTDAAAWFSLDEAHSLARVDLVDFVGPGFLTTASWPRTSRPERRLGAIRPHRTRVR